MELTNQLIGNLAQAYEKLAGTFAEETTSYSEFEQRFSGGERCPGQAELAPLLHGFQRMATTLAQFLEALGSLLSDEDAITAIRETPPEKRGGRKLTADQLLSFTWTIGDVDSKLEEKEVPTSETWKRTRNLIVPFSHFGSSPGSGFSLILQLPFLTSIFEETAPSRWEVYIDIAPRMLSSIRVQIQELYQLAEWAGLMATTPEDELISAIISWWCKRFDATLENGGTLSQLKACLNWSPDPANENVARRLNYLAENTMVDESIRKQAQARLALQIRHTQ